MPGCALPNRIPSRQWARLGLWALLILQIIGVGTSAGAMPVCSALFSERKLLAPKTILTAEYDKAQILAIGVNDHSNFEGFDHLATLIKERGHDPLLKSIVIEDVVCRFDPARTRDGGEF